MLRRTAGIGAFAFVCVSIGAPAQAQPVGAVTVGVALGKMMDQVNQAIISAKNAGLTVEMQAGVQAEIAIANAQSAFADSTDRLWDKHLDPTIAGTLDKLQGLVNDVSSGAFATVDEAAARAQQIANTLPSANGTPQVTSVTPRFVVPSRRAYPVVVRVKGNFVDAGQPGLDPTLAVNGKSYAGTGDTQTLQFNVPVTELLSPGQPPTAFGASKVELLIPWEKPRFWGLWHDRVVDDFKLSVGVLPQLPGKINVTVVNQVPHQEVKAIAGGGGRVCSQSECGNNDQIGVPVQLVPDAGWSIVPGSCDLHANAHGENSISGPDYSGNRCVWSLTTIHKTWGSSGIIDYGPTAQETRTVEVDTPNTTTVPISWGESEVVPVISGRWKVSFDSFDGKHAEFNTSDNSNKLLAVDAQLNSITLKAADPTKLDWP